MSRRFDIFLSYNSADFVNAEKLAKELSRVGLSVWFDKWEQQPGQTWQDSLQRGIDESRAIAVLLGPIGQGPWQKEELQMGLTRFKPQGGPIIPVLLPGAKDELPPFLELRNIVDCRNPNTYQEAVNRLVWGITGRQLNISISQIGESFPLHINNEPWSHRELLVRTLPNPDRGRLFNLSWQTFGHGIEFLVSQLRSYGTRLGVDGCFGINDAGLCMATFLSSAVFHRCPIGYLKCGKVGRDMTILRDSFFPKLPANAIIMLFDFEVKSSNVLNIMTDKLRERYKAPKFYFTVFGAMTESEDLKISGVDKLVGIDNLKLAGLEDVFIAFTMHPPGIEPPLELR